MNNITPIRDGWPMTREQRLALKKIRRDLQKMHLPNNGEQSLACAIYDLICVILPGIDLDDESDALPQAKVSD